MRPHAARRLRAHGWRYGGHRPGLIISGGLWGHNRSWLPEAKQIEARNLRIQNADNGLRRPVQN